MVTDQLLQRAKSALSATNISIEEIRQNFLDSGETEEDIYLAFKAAEVSADMNLEDWLSGNRDRL